MTRKYLYQDEEDEFYLRLNSPTKHVPRLKGAIDDGKATLVNNHSSEKNVIISISDNSFHFYYHLTENTRTIEKEEGRRKRKCLTGLAFYDAFLERISSDKLEIHR